jgi:hypothetical protein
MAWPEHHRLIFMLLRPTPATTSPKKGGAAAGVGRLLLMAALDVRSLSEH